MKKFVAFLLILTMAISLAACSGNSESKETRSSEADSNVQEEISVAKNESVQFEETESLTDTDSEAAGTKILVAYFSATGTTEGVAEHIANGLNADIYEIIPEEPYTDADLNYNDNSSRSTLEMNDSSARPAISGSVENMEQYDIVFIGFPIWWYVAPTIINTFLESYDFSGKRIILFATSGGSGFGKTAENLKKSVSATAEIIEGKLLNGNQSIEELKNWVSKF